MQADKKRDARRITAAALFDRYIHEGLPEADRKRLEVAQRNSKLQSVESKLKSREQTLNQRQEDITKKGQEMDLMRENLTAQLSVIEKKKTELDELKTREQAHLESLSGLSAAEAKDRLVESLKDEAKGQASAYVNEIIEEAKMTANKEAKRIIKIGRAHV